MVVTTSSEAYALFERLVARINDAEEKRFYMIGENYSPKSMNVGNLMMLYNLSNYSNELVDTFEIENMTYYVVSLTIKKN